MKNSVAIQNMKMIYLLLQDIKVELWLNNFKHTEVHVMKSYYDYSYMNTQKGIYIISNFIEFYVTCISCMDVS